MGRVERAPVIGLDPAEASLAAEKIARWSIEATRPTASEIATLSRTLFPGSAVYLTALPGRALDDHLAPIAALTKAGLDAVPHIPARRVASAKALTGFLEQARDAGPVDLVLLIAGEAERPHGPFAETLPVLQQVPFSAYGIRSVGLAGFPEGHLHVPRGAQLQALARKVDAAEMAGLAPFIVTQFGFNARTIVDWLRQVRAAGIACPIRIGIAGPANPATLTRFAVKCGVNLPGGGILSKLKLARSLLTGDPKAILQALDRAGVTDGAFGPVGYHVFTFGGLAKTLGWLAAEDTLGR